ncbi:Uncharacterized conserved protein YbjT, contains NAD(P)-binding and DUF2867 domains [Klenkia soli]|uniref:Uncharacterized conserved protein YbjT, contains NAD(P)-binding and DUF2867 domains n=1 Tax=Klenkia soli TaxID=1052260 RepID=A0A1H0FUN8_9ACTN|nr:NmrA/HSCARG family protein [Klenkia soli]SDN98350.1 Uncharacterized conserved protein YbjT, contains NAD(P)-binding and DUF2867 domains [Klenkia soli]
MSTTPSTTGSDDGPGDRPVVVLGATGQQGGAVVRALRERGRAVRAVVRDPAGARARTLAAGGVEVVPGDLDDAASLRSAMTGAHGVFSVQPSSGQAGSGVTDEDEVRFGLAVADAAQAAGVAHLVYSSANAVGPVPTGVGHVDTKARIEEHVRALPTPSTVIRPAAFMEILLLPGSGLPDGRFSFLARPDQAMQFIAARDVGRVVAQVLAAPSRWAGRTVELAGDALTGDALAAVLAGHLGRPVEYRRIPDDVLARERLLGRLAALVDDGRLAGRADLDALRADFPFLLRFDDWLAGPGSALLDAALRPTSGGVSLR